MSNIHVPEDSEFLFECPLAFEFTLLGFSYCSKSVLGLHTNNTSLQFHTLILDFYSTNTECTFTKLHYEISRVLIQNYIVGFKYSLFSKLHCRFQEFVIDFSLFCVCVFSNISTLLATVWRKRFWRRVLSYNHCATPCLCTRRRLICLSRPSYRVKPHKVWRVRGYGAAVTD